MPSQLHLFSASAQTENCLTSPHIFNLRPLITQLCDHKLFGKGTHHTFSSCFLLLLASDFGHTHCLQFSSYTPLPFSIPAVLNARYGVKHDIKFECVTAASEADCLKKIQDDAADITTVGGGLVAQCAVEWLSKIFVQAVRNEGPFSCFLLYVWMPTAEGSLPAWCPCIQMLATAQLQDCSEAAHG